MDLQESFINSPDHHRIPLLSWAAEAPSAVLVIAHGMAEHAARYQPLALWLNQQGVSVIAIQHRGHGPHCPETDLGHYADHKGWQKVVDDLQQVVVHARKQHPDLPLTLFGHSMGSFIAQAFSQQYGDQIDRLILCATNRIDKPKLRASLALVRSLRALRGKRHHSRLIDNMTFGAFNKAFSPNRTSHDWLSRDPQQVDRYLRDPLCGFPCTAGLWSDFIGGMLTINPKTWRKDLPIHLLAGDSDPVGEMGHGFNRHVANLRGAGLLVASDRLFPGARHELVNETNADEVWHHILDCLRTGTDSGA
ncbi:MULTISPECIES: alpha/beta fold hydrolase [Marinobacter]|jgi:alpha-beta hydrolase superfamily lysophospholipase|uniref:alpha/beta fold hydrolase n=1 Tax=Marinobacter TaxID=2742 RepID=UPI00094916B4|nr:MULTISPECIES: alpha/beta fold hydrolase [Marinobacter]MCZ4283842.1 alpha/beta fold hydrolase [Marinobacter salarius]MDC8456716.1 lysophospholipase [Marinobacter sp. DS40M6]OLF85497.1 alpha/beta hydrolase [Marinobacter sp. C18]VVT21879.1 Alpha/beta hydrolase [Marinobacter salarius]VXB75116.1 putative Lysophospholipase [Marinobacter salarius]|tara:strand:- start:1000 stop:1917 length:918 start_codon:yes stop_codon:yes gene_type:complete